MIKIGKYQIETQVYQSSDGKSYNFACDKSYQKNIESGFATATSVEFDFGDSIVTLYAPKLIVEQIRGEEITALFSAATIPEDKSASYEESIANLTETQTDNVGTTEAIAEGIEELAMIVAELEERVTALEGGK